MSIIDDLVNDIVKNNAVTLDGVITIGFVNGGVKVTGNVHSTLEDVKKKKNLLKVTIPIEAQVGVPEIVVPLQIPRPG
jgi:DUF4097 and DUF4098 domain-containing protein YvlB